MVQVIYYQAVTSPSFPKKKTCLLFPWLKKFITKHYITKVSLHSSLKTWNRSGYFITEKLRRVKTNIKNTFKRTFNMLMLIYRATKQLEVTCFINLLTDMITETLQFFGVFLWKISNTNKAKQESIVPDSSFLLKKWPTYLLLYYVLYIC